MAKSDQLGFETKQRSWETSHSLEVNKQGSKARLEIPNPLFELYEGYSMGGTSTPMSSPY